MNIKCKIIGRCSQVIMMLIITLLLEQLGEPNDGVAMLEFTEHLQVVGSVLCVLHT